MNKLKRVLSMVLAVTLVLSMAAAMSGCKDQTGGEVTDPTGTNGANTTYTVSVRSQGGMAMAGIDVYIYADNSLADMKQYGETDENGNVSFQLPESADYAIVVSGAPKGYSVEASYSFSGNAADIALTSALIQGESLSGATLGLGDVMYDFSIMTPSGDTVVLSEMLAEKKMVLLNFWFSTCGPCANEFPYMEEAYQMYQDDVGIIAMDPLQEGNAAIAAYQASMGTTFPMAECPAAWSATFGITGYPTSVVVDRYGVITLIEVGGITSLRPFTSLFETMTADDYEQKLYTSIGEMVTAIKPTYTMDTSENVAAILNSGDIEVTYRPETEGESAEMSWPFIAAEKNGEKCLKASNQQIDDSFAILYADVTLKAGQAVGFDYLASTERGSDVMFVIVNDEDIYQISGVSDPEEWKRCYPWVAEEDGTYEIALCYLKDDSTSEGDDTVYIKNMRVTDASAIDVQTYIPRYAATSEDGFTYAYANVILNSSDNYYHVGSENGPLLLVNMMGYTEFSEEQTLWDIVYNGGADVDGRDMYTEMLDYFSYASNASLNGYCTVTKELAELLKVVDQAAGFDDEDTNEWLRLCSYYQVYGPGSSQLTDPIKGLAPFSAYTASFGTGVESNYFYYDRAIIPRGLLAEFVPDKSGVYRITSHNESQQGVDAWIFNGNREELLVYEQDERLWNDSNEVSMVFYMEAGQKYYIDIAFWDMYEVGYIYYDIAYIGATYDHFRLCAPGYFTYDTNATGDAMYHLISGGISAVLGDDGIYYHDLGNGEKGSKIYVDFTGLTSLFSKPIATVQGTDGNGNPIEIKGMIDLGGFDFSKTEDDLYILGIMAQNNNDVEATDAYLKKAWGEDYDAYAEIYQLEDVYAGIYHGEGEDLTQQIKTYLDDMIHDGHEEREGCVVVTKELAELLQKLMDKYTFADVDQSWLKMCYYYDYLGPEG